MVPAAATTAVVEQVLDPLPCHLHSSTRLPPRLPPLPAGCTFGALALGRFVFLPYHRSALAKAGMPKQNDMTHLQAGDIRAEEASFVLKTNDPAGEPASQ